jgi:His-Xaa-Ser system radical SAM maturase HxsC
MRPYWICRVISTQSSASSVPGIFALNIDYLEDGYVVLMQPNGMVRTLYRRSSRHNTIFATDRCNSLCLMCSQPPRDVDDQHLVKQHLRLVELIDARTEELGITGGEPTLLGDGFLSVVEACKAHLPETSLHVLTNGRAFKDASFACRLAAIGHPDLMLGIPLYADVSTIHDYVVQAEGAFDETMLGLHRLATFGVNIEVRVVVHKETYERLVPLAEFMYRNVPFAAHVTFMGLEMIGFAVTNRELLWIDPIIYQNQLVEAVHFLAARGMKVSIYNHQLCTIPRTVWRYARQSISDWKNQYLPVCEQCDEKSNCGGFFTFNIQHRAVSNYIQAIRHL